MRPLLLIVCLGLSFSLPARDHDLSLSSSMSGLRKVSTAASLAPSGENGTHGWSLDARLRDRDGGDWALCWTLTGDIEALTQAVAGRAGAPWHAAVVLTTPDGQVHERLLSSGAGFDGRVAATAADWEWRSQGEALFPARLRLVVDDRELILLLQGLNAPAVEPGDPSPRVRVRGFVNRGLEKTYLSGHGHFEQDWQMLAEDATPSAIGGE